MKINSSGKQSWKINLNQIMKKIEDDEKEDDDDDEEKEVIEEGFKIENE